MNIDAKLIEKAVNKIHQGKREEVHSMLVFKDGKLVFEDHFKGHECRWDGSDHHGELATWDRDMQHTVMSVGKSITSTRIRIAIDKGFIDLLYYPLSLFFTSKEGAEYFTEE